MMRKRAIMEIIPYLGLYLKVVLKISGFRAKYLLISRQKKEII